MKLVTTLLLLLLPLLTPARPDHKNEESFTLLPDLDSFISLFPPCYSACYKTLLLTNFNSPLYPNCSMSGEPGVAVDWACFCFSKRADIYVEGSEAERLWNEGNEAVDECLKSKESSCTRVEYHTAAMDDFGLNDLVAKRYAYCMALGETMKTRPTYNGNLTVHYAPKQPQTPLNPGDSESPNEPLQVNSESSGIRMKGLEGRLHTSAIFLTFTFALSVSSGWIWGYRV